MLAIILRIVLLVAMERISRFSIKESSASNRLRQWLDKWPLKVAKKAEQPVASNGETGEHIQLKPKFPRARKSHESSFEQNSFLLDQLRLLVSRHLRQ